MKLPISVVVPIVFLCSGCVAFGDNALRITGVISRYDVDHLESCSLSLYKDEISSVILQEKVTRSIDVSYTIEPKRRDYTIGVRCDGADGPYIYESEALELGGKSKETIALGKIELIRKRVR